MNHGPLSDCAAAIAAAATDSKLQSAYMAWLRTMLASERWAPSNPEGLMIPWRSFRAAAKSAELGPVCESLGIYAFVTGQGVPRYIGKAEKQPIKRRMNGRYLNKSTGQFELASLIERGCDIPPRVVTDPFYKSRLRGAKDFAQHGVEGIWIGLLPIECATSVAVAERKLIGAANEANLRAGMEPLINKQLMDGGN